MAVIPSKSADEAKKYGKAWDYDLVIWQQGSGARLTRLRDGRTRALEGEPGERAVWETDLLGTSWERNMSAVVIVGAQWGDEGKGKVVDLYAPYADLVVRYAGGANAGHTLVVRGEKLILHLIPSGHSSWANPVHRRPGYGD